MIIRYTCYIYAFRCSDYEDIGKFRIENDISSYKGNKKVKKRLKRSFKSVIPGKVINQHNRPYRKPVKGKSYKGK